MSSTLVQYCTNVIPMFCVCWVKLDDVAVDFRFRCGTPYHNSTPSIQSVVCATLMSGTYDTLAARGRIIHFNVAASILPGSVQSKVSNTGK